MTKPLIQIDDEIREMTDKEFEKHELILAEATAKQAEATAKAQAKAELLDRLGITEDEAKLLLA
jgi:hypothetical protein